jgi:hypothetical protein
LNLASIGIKPEVKLEFSVLISQAEE